MKKVIFSAVFGMKATYNEIFLDGWDKIIFTDNPQLINAHSCWKVKIVQKPIGNNDTKSNRYFKVKVNSN